MPSKNTVIIIDLDHTLVKANTSLGFLKMICKKRYTILSILFYPLKLLNKISGKDFVSNKTEDLFIYSQDPGASEPRPVDFVVLPKTVEEIQKIVKLANREKIPLVPMGGGLTLSGLIIPIRGGIVLDLKRMNQILEINELNRYALLEPGVTTGIIKGYLDENYPDLQPPIPDAPPSATVAGNMLIHGSGSLSQKYGCHRPLCSGSTRRSRAIPQKELFLRETPWWKWDF